MEPLDNPKAWVPYYVNSKDCSQGFCNLYCPQWCYNILSPPPSPPPFKFTYDNSSPKLSPLVIAIIGIFASAVLLLSYYTIISKYCGNTTRREIDDVASEELEYNHNPSFHDQYEPWLVATRGLDEALIKSITVYKYKKGDDLIEVTDCTVCLSEFEEDGSIRLLPKCNHAFHVPCIDTWLKSHSNCPLCRANIFFICVAQSPPQLPPILTDHHQTPQTQGTIENEGADHEEEEDIERGINVAEGEILLMNNEMPRTPFRAFSFSDLGNLRGTDTMIEIADGGYNQQIRRSVSMDHSSQSRVSVADIIEEKEPLDAGSSKHSTEIVKSSHRNNLMNMYCAINQVTLKRSFTSGRFSLLNRQRRLRDTIIPL